MKKWVSLTLALCLLAGLATSAVAEEEKYTYTILTAQAGVLDDDAYMVNYWSEYYGVEFIVDSVEQGSENELIPLRLAGGDVPDILYWYRDRLMQLVDEGMYGTFSYETLQEHGPLIYEQMAAKEGLLEYCSIDGELFTFGYQPHHRRVPQHGRMAAILAGRRGRNRAQYAGRRRTHLVQICAERSRWQWGSRHLWPFPGRHGRCVQCVRSLYRLDS